MKARIITLMIAVAIGFAYPALAQDPPSNVSKIEEEFGLDLSALENVSEFSVMKIEDVKFKVEDFDGIDVTQDVKALKTPNRLDLLFYEQETEATSICYDFYSTETKNNKWLMCDLIPESSTGLYWVLSNNFKSFYIIQNGSYLDMVNFKLKASPSNPNEYIVQENGVDKYVMKDLKGKNLDEFYPLELLSQ